jgi:pilus assembly protein CpaF
MQKLIESGTISENNACILQKLIKDKKNIFIAGSTGSGKTTLLSTLINEIAHNQRIIIIEDAFEIQVCHPHVVRLQSKLANSEGKGEYTLSKLIKQSLRMRPDRIVLGECRGSEVTDVLMALNTGHAGSLATIHANSANDVLPRLMALGSLAGVSPVSIKAMAKSAIDYIVYIKKEQNTGKRVVKEIIKFNE